VPVQGQARLVKYGRRAGSGTRCATVQITGAPGSIQRNRGVSVHNHCASESILCSCFCAATRSDHVAGIASQAVLQSVPPVQSSSPPLSPRVRFVAVLGPETMASCSVDGVLLDILLPSDLNGPFSHISQMEDFKVLLFSEALEPREPGLAGVQCRAATTDSFPTAAEGGGGSTTTAYEIADAHASRFESIGIRLVACRELVGNSCAAIKPQHNGCQHCNFALLADNMNLRAQTFLVCVRVVLHVLQKRESAQSSARPSSIEASCHSSVCPSATSIQCRLSVHAH
jgi:hypothetical protein